MKKHTLIRKHNIKKAVVSLIAALSLGMCLTACGGSGGGDQSQSGTGNGSASSAAAEDGLLRTAVLYDISTMDVTQTTDDYMIPMNIFDRLFETRTVDGTAQVVKSLCEDYSVSEDGLKYTEARSLLPMSNTALRGSSSRPRRTPIFLLK